MSLMSYFKIIAVEIEHWHFVCFLSYFGISKKRNVSSCKDSNFSLIWLHISEKCVFAYDAAELFDGL